MDKMFVKKLAEAYGPSGRESAVRGLIEKEVAPLCDEVTTDTLGSLVAHKKGSGKKILLITHMDTAGLIVTEVDEKGFARVMNVGEGSAAQTVGRSLRFENGARAAAYYGTEKALEKADLFDVFLDFGVAGRDAARELADIGDMAVFDGGITDLGVRLSGSGISDRIGCAILVDVLRHAKTDCDLYVVFSAQERVGGRAAGAAAYAIMPDFAVNVHAGVAGDCPGAKRACLKLGAGPAVEVMDQTAIVPVSMRNRLKRAAEDALVPYQNDVLRCEGSDTAGVQRTKTGVFTGVVSIPTRYLGSGAEMIDLSDAENAAKLLLSFLKNEG